MIYRCPSNEIGLPTQVIICYCLCQSRIFPHHVILYGLHQSTPSWHLKPLHLENIWGRRVENNHRLLKYSVNSHTYTTCYCLCELCTMVCWLKSWRGFYLMLAWETSLILTLSHKTSLVGVMNEKAYEGGPYIVVSLQPQCKHLCQAFTGRGWLDCIKFTPLNPQGDTKVLPTPSKVCHCWSDISKIFLIYRLDHRLVANTAVNLAIPGHWSPLH